MKHTILTVIVLVLTLSCSSEKEKRVETLTTDGAWCWFSDPRAIYTHGENPGIMTGWVKKDGTIEVTLLDKKGDQLTQILHENLDKDDHANPAFAELTTGDPMVFYAKHTDSVIRYHLKSSANEALFDAELHASPFDEEELKEFPVRRVTYVNPFVLEEEQGKLYCFGRWTGFKPNFMISEDDGKSFTTSKVLITNYPFDSGNRPYVKYHSDGKSKIHLVFTDGHPRNELTNSVYYAYYEKGAFWRADGSKICTVEELPFEPKDATMVYKADKTKGKSWVFDIASDSNGNPVIAYTRYPDDEHHLNHIAAFNGSTWVDTFICDSGNWFPQTPEGKKEPEPNYSGGMAIHSINTREIYVSERVNGVFEIVKYTLNKNGGINKRLEVTKNSEFDNVRPVVPRNMKKDDPTAVLWMHNKKYIHYTNYDTEIRYFVE